VFVKTCPEKTDEGSKKWRFEKRLKAMIEHKKGQAWSEFHACPFSIICPAFAPSDL
jgi:hypothetical protein